MKPLVNICCRLIAIACAVERGLAAQTQLALPLVARFLFLVTLFDFFIRSALTKFGDGLLGLVVPSPGAFAQILPKKAEAVAYNVSELGFIDWLIIMAGSYGEIILPVLIVVGLATRFAALGMLVFILVMSVVDVAGHGVGLGALLDGDPTSLIPDQRLFWAMPLLVLAFMGGGKFSLDRLLIRHFCPPKKK